jgi:cyclomaltodextrin glucanotransferase
MKNASSAIPTTHLHVSDVEFRAETIYFLVLDRFSDGCPDNLDQSSPLNDLSRHDWNKYWGGDLQGVINKLDYLQSLGITAIWVTPLFEQVEGLEHGLRAPLHGYWTKDFKRINPRWINDPNEVRLFTRNDTVFDRLIAELHRRGMKFILDIVCNHSSPDTTDGKGRLYDDGQLVADFNNDQQSWYHHYGQVTNWEDEWQVQNCELGGLAKFNENNIDYRRYIKNAIKSWLGKGVDAIRIDTVKHMPIWFWQEFTADLQTHKPDIFIFGEWIHSHPLRENSVLFANQAGMSLLDFGFCQSIRECLGENKPEGFQLVDKVIAEDIRYRSANELVTFFENHDMPRLQTLDNRPESVHLALILVLTSRGIPCLYYGCEQYLHNDTDGGQDPYNRPMMEKWDTQTEAFRIVQVLSRERAANQAIQWGSQQTLWVEPDLYIYLRRYHGFRCLVALNRGGAREIELAHVDFPADQMRCLLSGEEISMRDGKMKLQLPERGARIFAIRGEAIQGQFVSHVQVNGAPTQPGETLAIIGDCERLGAWDLRRAIPMECINANTWFTEVDWGEDCGKPVAYKYVILSSEPNTAPRREVRVVRRRSIPEQGVTKWRDIWEE